MKFNIVKSSVTRLLVCAVIITSCQKNVAPDATQIRSSQQSRATVTESPLTGKWRQFSPVIRAKNASLVKTDEYYKEFFARIHEGVDPTECSATALDGIITGYLNEFDFWDFVLFGDYLSISQLAAIIDES